MNPIKEVDTNGTIRYRLNGRLHCEDGPAIIYADGSCAWWINGCYYCDFEDWCSDLKKSDEEIFLLKLKYGV